MEPTSEPTLEPTATPTPSPEPTAEPTLEPTATPVVETTELQRVQNLHGGASEFIRKKLLGCF